MEIRKKEVLFEVEGEMLRRGRNCSSLSGGAGRLFILLITVLLLLFVVLVCRESKFESGRGGEFIIGDEIGEELLFDGVGFVELL